MIIKEDFSWKLLFLGSSDFRENSPNAVKWKTTLHHRKKWETIWIPKMRKLRIENS